MFIKQPPWVRVTGIILDPAWNIDKVNRRQDHIVSLACFWCAMCNDLFFLFFQCTFGALPSLTAQKMHMPAHMWVYSKLNEVCLLSEGNIYQQQDTRPRRHIKNRQTKWPAGVAAMRYHFHHLFFINIQVIYLLPKIKKIFCLFPSFIPSEGTNKKMSCSLRSCSLSLTIYIRCSIPHHIQDIFND